MSSDYLKKPILEKHIEYKTLKSFSFTTCEMQGKTISTKDGERVCKMQYYFKRLLTESISSVFLMDMEDLK